MCFRADRVDAAIRSAAVGHLLQFVVDAAFDLLKVDHLGPALLRGHGEALWHAIDRNHATRSEHPRALDGKLPNRSATPHCNRIARFNLGILRRHVTGREDVGKKEDLLIGERVVLDFLRAYVRERDAEIFGLAAGI